MGLPSTQITLQQFIGIQNSQGQFKTFTDIHGKHFATNLTNSEVLGAPIVKPTQIIGDNVILEMTMLPGVGKVDLTNPKKQIPKLDKLIFSLSQDYWGQLTFDIRDKRSCYAWSEYVGQWMGNMYKRYSDQNNLIITDTLIKTCLATGNYKIDKVAGANGYSKNDYYDCSQRLVNELNRIATTRTDYHLGIDPSKMFVLGSYKANQNDIIGKNFISAANLSLERLESGTTGDTMGYKNVRTMYLGQKVSQKNSKGEDVYAYDYDFTNYAAVLYTVDSLKAYGHEFDNTIFPVNALTYQWSKIWRINATVVPTYEPLNCLICNNAPTLAEINAARTQLRTEQPGIYNANYDAMNDLTQADVDKWNVEKDIYGSRVSVETLNAGAVVSTKPLLSNDSVNVDLDLSVIDNKRSITVSSNVILGMSIDLASVKCFGGLNPADISITPISNREIEIKAVKALTDGQFFTINVLRDNEKYGTIYAVNKADTKVKSVK